MAELEFPRRLEMANLPTPLQRFHTPWQPFNGLQVWIKKDDLTGSVLTGNKVRKLDYLVADAVSQGAGTLITCGGLQSNHARATAIAAAMNGMQSVLFLRGDAPDVADGNVLLDRLVGARIIHITPEQYSKQRTELMAEEAARLARDEDRTAYVIPEGGSNPLGCWGYINMVAELQSQLEDSIDTIVCATGSGGTQAGLMIGCRLFMPHTRVVGINVCDDAAYFTRVIGGLLEGWAQRYQPHGLTETDIQIADGYVGLGYARNTSEELSVLKDLATASGIILDPVYTLKAFIGLGAEAHKGRFPRGSRILFVHTGGIFGVFPKREQFSW